MKLKNLLFPLPKPEKRKIPNWFTKNIGHEVYGEYGLDLTKYIERGFLLYLVFLTSFYFSIMTLIVFLINNKNTIYHHAILSKIDLIFTDKLYSSYNLLTASVLMSLIIPYYLIFWIKYSPPTYLDEQKRKITNFKKNKNISTLKVYFQFILAMIVLTTCLFLIKDFFIFIIKTFQMESSLAFTTLMILIMAIIISLYNMALFMFSMYGCVLFLGRK